MRTYTPEQRLKQREHHKRYRQTEKGKAKSREAAKRNSKTYLATEKGRATKFKIYLRKAYGITPAQYEDMSKEQGGVCLVCRGVNEDGERLHVDHDHETGKVRGLLCNRCNVALGYAGDNAYNLMRPSGVPVNKGISI